MTKRRTALARADRRSAGRQPADGHAQLGQDLLEGSLAHEAIVSDGLNVEETSIGLKADLPKRGEGLQSFADVDGRFVRSAPFNLKYCLIREPLWSTGKEQMTAYGQKIPSVVAAR